MGTPYLGEIRLMCVATPPKGWALCNGQLLSVTSNQALFALLGNVFGGTSPTSFALPNLGGGALMGSGGGYTMGQTGGEANHTLTLAEMPQHTHTLSAVDATADAGIAGTKPSSTSALAQARAGTSGPVNHYGTGAVSTALAGDAVGSTGGGQGHSNMQPYLALNYYIALQGIYPTRA